MTPDHAALVAPGSYNPPAMPASIIIGTMLFILIVGSVIAVAWWRLASRAAPYQDEHPRANAEEPGRREREVVVVSDRSATGQAGAGGRNGG